MLYSDLPPRNEDVMNPIESKIPSNIPQYLRSCMYKAKDNIIMYGIKKDFVLTSIRVPNDKIIHRKTLFDLLKFRDIP